MQMSFATEKEGKKERRETLGFPHIGLGGENPSLTPGEEGEGGYQKKRRHLVGTNPGSAAHKKRICQKKFFTKSLFNLDFLTHIFIKKLGI